MFWQVLLVSSDFNEVLLGQNSLQLPVWHLSQSPEGVPGRRPPSSVLQRANPHSFTVTFQRPGLHFVADLTLSSVKWNKLFPPTTSSSPNIPAVFRIMHGFSSVSGASTTKTESSEVSTQMLSDFIQSLVSTVLSYAERLSSDSGQSLQPGQTQQTPTPFKLGQRGLCWNPHMWLSGLKSAEDFHVWTQAQH